MGFLLVDLKCWNCWHWWDYAEQAAYVNTGIIQRDKDQRGLKIANNGKLYIISANQISLYQLFTLYLWSHLSLSNHHVFQIIFIFHTLLSFLLEISLATWQLTASFIAWILFFLSLATCYLSPAVDNKIGIFPRALICISLPYAFVVSKSPGHGRK